MAMLPFGSSLMPSSQLPDLEADSCRFVLDLRIGVNRRLETL